MSSALDCIAQSLSVPRPRAISGADVVNVIRSPREIRHDGLMDSFFTEISLRRIVEAVGEGHFTYAEIVLAAEAYGLGGTATAAWGREMRS